MKITEEMMKQGASGEGALTEPGEGQVRSTGEKSELEKLKEMSAKDRVWYVFAYYKFHILAALAVFFLIYIAGLTIYRAGFSNALHCLYINSRSEEPTNLAPLETDFADWLGLGEKELVHVETLFISYGDQATTYSIANMEKIAALSASGELDVMICDIESLEHYAGLGGFLDLNEILPPELLARVKSRLYLTAGEDGRERAYAVDLSGLPFTQASALAQTPPLLGIISSSQRIDTAISLIQYIFQ